VLSRKRAYDGDHGVSEYDGCASGWLDGFVCKHASDEPHHPPLSLPPPREGEGVASEEERGKREAFYFM